MTVTIAATYKVRLGEPDHADLGASTGTINLNTDTIKARLLMTTNDAETDLAATSTVVTGDITTLAEFDGSNYTANGELIAIDTAAYNAGATRYEWKASSDTVFSNLGDDASNNVGGVLINRDVSFEVISFHTGGFPKVIPVGGADLRIVWATDGILAIG